MNRLFVVICIMAFVGCSQYDLENNINTYFTSRDVRHGVDLDWDRISHNSTKSGLIASGIGLGVGIIGAVFGKAKQMIDEYQYEKEMEEYEKELESENNATAKDNNTTIPLQAE
ncbi:putative membrane protein [Campylobacter pinnipediorum subsp. pinnipediorum]|uniref:hypothetical protein n=1 Tax=Campylobacter pinnipediorum TaxID=1965231 RepID=UPI0009950317|nr:hypothetical protein [Campylobacter pinnipediorum]AQW81392.1 putative membrane protein [Campylobacter pinnipediorum subsp. pinnipediorum]